MKIYHSLSSEGTQAFGEALARRLTAAGRKKGKNPCAAVLALQGDLGAGKTTFTQGFLRGLGIKKRAQSPTFIIMRRHRVPERNAGAATPFKNVFHVDAYRLKKAGQMRALDFQEILSDPRNVILIEWPERIKKILPKSATWIVFRHGKKENERTIIIKK